MPDKQEPVADLVERLRAFAQGCRGSMWQSRDETIGLMDEAAATLASLEAENARLRKERDDAQTSLAATLREAAELAVALHARWYRETAPQWELLPDAPGIISQIDNMTAGMGERIQLAEKRLRVEKKRGSVLETEIDHLRRRLGDSAQRASDDSCLTIEEQRAQGKRCPCMGSDDYCQCQNVPDAETRRARNLLETKTDG